MAPEPGVKLKNVETDRLLLRQWKEADFEHYAEYFADEEMAKYVGGLKNRDEAWRSMALQIGHWALKGFGYWAVEEKATNDFVGSVGLWFSEGWPELELGYWLTRNMQGKGYATEAALKSREVAVDVLGAKTLVSYIHAD